MEVPWAYHYAGPAGPDRRGRARGGEQPVRARPRRAARQRRLRRPELVVRLGLARPVPRRRPEPLPGQRARRSPSPGSTSAGKELVIETTGFVEPDAGGPAQYVQSVTFNDEPLDGAG